MGAILYINYANTGNVYLALIVLSTIPVLLLAIYVLVPICEP